MQPSRDPHTNTVARGGACIFVVVSRRIHAYPHHSTYVEGRGGEAAVRCDSDQCGTHGGKDGEEGAAAAAAAARARRARRMGGAATAGAVAAPSAPRAGSEEGLSAAQQSGTPRRSSRRQPPLRDVTAAPGAGRCAPDPRPLSHPPDPPARRTRPLCAGSSAYCQIATFERSARVPHVTRAQESLRQTRSVYSPRASRRKPRAFRPSRGCSRCASNTV